MPSKKPNKRKTRQTEASPALEASNAGYPEIRRLPEVITDKQEIWKTRLRYKKKLDRLLDKARERIRSGEEPSWEHQKALRLCAKHAAEKLSEIMLNARVFSAGRVMAARMLTVLGETSGEEFIVECLQAAPSLRNEALHFLGQRACKIKLTAPDRAGRLLSLVDNSDPRVSRTAAELSLRQRVPGAVNRVLPLLTKGQFENGGEIALLIAGNVDSSKQVRAILPHLFQEKPPDYLQDLGAVLQQTLTHPNPAVAEPIRRALHKFTLQFKGNQLYHEPLVHDLARTAERKSIPVLEDIFEKTPDPECRRHAAEALARLQPSRAVDLILECLDKDRHQAALMNLLQKHAGPKDASRIVRAVLRCLERSRQEGIDKSVVALFLQLGKKGLQALERNEHRIELDARWWGNWKLRRLDARCALSDFHRDGVLSKEPDQVLDQLAADLQQDGYSDPLDVTNPNELIRALGTAGLVTAVDVETGMVPCNHPSLIQEFAEGTAGKFLPECPVQDWRRSGGKEPYTVQFLHQGRLYRFPARDYGDYYDIEAVVDALHFAMNNAGYRERFIPLYTEGQVAMYVFADPAVFFPLAEHYQVPLQKDFDEGFEGDTGDQEFGEDFS